MARMAPVGRRPGWLGAALAVVVVTGATVAAHAPVLDAQALTLDDRAYIESNYLVRNPGLDSVRQLFAEIRAPSTVRGYYHPLAMVSLMGDCALGALPSDL